MKIFKQISGQGEDVVLLHGWGCDHRHMQPIADQLSGRYRVTNVDLPGCGQSDWHDSIETIRDFADQLLPHLPKQAIYIGWSFGGLVSMSIGARYPERMKRFIGIGTIPKFVTGDDWEAIPQPGFKKVFEEGISKVGFKKFLEDYYDVEFQNIDPKPAAYHKLLKLLDETDNVDMDVLYKGVEIVDNADLRAEFAALQCPIDLIFGGKDNSIPTVTHENVKKLNPAANIHIIKDSNHMSFWTYPDEFNAILETILDQS